MKEKDLWAALGYAGKFSWGETRKGHFVVRREGTQFPASLAVGHDGEVKRCYVRNLCRHFGLEEE
ncbi:MAG: hypothetical protein FDZ70_03300 [Actinobacteria bacterium]|nr:MAG: hypothetical protein FDZ70_03300 [Actinomycetota bacterium]